MVVEKVMGWSPWAPATAMRKKERKYEVRIRVTRLEGLSPLIGVVAVGIKWKGPPRAGGILRRMKRGKQVRSVSGERAVRITGAVEFGEEEENEFGNACCFSESGSNPNSFGLWEVSFSVLHGIQDEREGKKEKKMAEIGTTLVNLAEWAWAFQSQKHAGGVEGKESQLQVQRQQLPITLVKDGSSIDATLYVDVSFVERKTPKETSDIPAQLMVKKDGKEDEEPSDDSCIFVANEEEKVVEFKSRIRAASTSRSSSSSGGSSPELQLGSASKRGFLSWRKRRKIASRSIDDKEGGSGETQPSSNSSTNKQSPGSDQDEDPIGSWESKEFISRDRQMKLKAQTFLASIDQRDESAGGESACTALVAVIAEALHSKGANTPTRSEFDALIREGSLEWQKLCNDASYIERFPNKHFDLDTILEAEIRPISVLSEKSFIGFFQPESFKSLRGAMSFDDIWNEITSDFGGDQRVYIVSWNDHFFVLKVESNAYYVMDTLGERLFEGCTKAYILRFDDSTEMHRLPENSKNGDGDELICGGKECCREFIKRFLAAIPLREELEVEEKGMGNANTALHQRLQIEFHLTEASNRIVQ